MNGLKEMMQYVVGLSKPEIFTLNSSQYSDKELHRIDEELRAKALEMTTLSGLVDYIKGDIDRMASNMIVHIVSPEEVRLISCLDSDRKRETLVAVKADIPHFPFEKFIGSEEFLINIRAKFIQNEDAEKLLRFAGTTEAGTVNGYSDDGISQSATVKQGIASKETVLVPNPVKLMPRRTFTEVKQPESEFIFRMKNYDDEVRCALFEADGGAWKRAAMQNIKEHLEYELEDLTQFTVIS